MTSNVTYVSSIDNREKRSKLNNVIKSLSDFVTCTTPDVTCQNYGIIDYCGTICKGQIIPGNHKSMRSGTPVTACGTYIGKINGDGNLKVDNNACVISFSECQTGTVTKATTLTVDPSAASEDSNKYTDTGEIACPVEYCGYSCKDSCNIIHCFETFTCVYVRCFTDHCVWKNAYPGLDSCFENFCTNRVCTCIQMIGDCKCTWQGGRDACNGCTYLAQPAGFPIYNPYEEAACSIEPICGYRNVFIQNPGTSCCGRYCINCYDWGVTSVHTSVCVSSVMDNCIYPTICWGFDANNIIWFCAKYGLGTYFHYNRFICDAYDYDRDRSVDDSYTVNCTGDNMLRCGETGVFSFGPVLNINCPINLDNGKMRFCNNPQDFLDCYSHYFVSFPDACYCAGKDPATPYPVKIKRNWGSPSGNTYYTTGDKNADLCFKRNDVIMHFTNPQSTYMNSCTGNFSITSTLVCCCCVVRCRETCYATIEDDIVICERYY